MTMYGLVINEASGVEGNIEIPGLGAVVAIITHWKIERRGESESAGPIWQLHAVLSFQNDVMLRNQSLKKRLKLVLGSGKGKTAYLADLPPEAKVDEGTIDVQGVVLWSS